MYVALHIQNRYSSEILMKLEFSRHVFVKNLKYQIS